ncbi:lipopolysaccharide biosynthesis protein [Paraburkholderia sp. CI3]|uniref:lipopolysaccharide biosynthesis protein n=1 Tax=Paraburkholderia sp. CI3 TaxID=2991060 RepID=UPI003D254AAD
MGAIRLACEKGEQRSSFTSQIHRNERRFDSLSVKFDAASSASRAGGTLISISLALILGAAFAHSAHILQIFAWMFPFTAFNEFIAGYVLFPRRKDRMLATVGIGSALLNIIVALVLAPGCGAVGLALARVISETTLSAMSMAIVIRLRLIRLIPGCERAVRTVWTVCGIRDPAPLTKDE